MGNIQWCWHARKTMTKMPPLDNVTEILLEGNYIYHTLDNEDNLQVYKKHAYHMDKLPPYEKL